MRGPPLGVYQEGLRGQSGGAEAWPPRVLSRQAGLYSGPGILS